MNSLALLRSTALLLALAGTSIQAFSSPAAFARSSCKSQQQPFTQRHQQQQRALERTPPFPSSSSSLLAAVPDLDTIALVAGQENYGLAIVSVGEALWSFSQSPSMDNIKVLIPGIVIALVLFFVSGPMITSGVTASVSLGLWVATLSSVALGGSYLLRLLTPDYASSSGTPKEIAALGLLVAVAGFFSFSQNLVVDGFVTLPDIPLPSLPRAEAPTDFEDDLYILK